MQEVNLFGIFIEILNKHQVQYFATGSVAAIVYGEPRLTHDIDFVIHLDEDEIETFESLFAPEYFHCPPKEVIRTEWNRTSRGHFNVIHLETGFKADMYLMGREDLLRWAMDNIQRIEMSGMVICVAPPEYVILKKLEYYKEGKSQKHLSDIDGILSNSRERINFEFLRDKIIEMGLNDVWKFLVAQSAGTEDR